MADCRPSPPQTVRAYVPGNAIAALRLLLSTLTAGPDLALGRRRERASSRTHSRDRYRSASRRPDLGAQYRARFSKGAHLMKRLSVVAIALSFFVAACGGTS